MKRKQFLTGLLAIPAAIPLSKPDPFALTDEEGSGRIPPYLQVGDLVGITSPAGYITHEEIQPAILQMKSWGLKIKPGSSIGKRDFTFGGTDEERVRDMQDMLNHPTIKAIMCARGGYGMVRIID